MHLAYNVRRLRMTCETDMEAMAQNKCLLPMVIFRTSRRRTLRDATL